MRRASFFVSLRVLLFGRHPDRTSGELMAVLTQLQLSGFPNRGILKQWCCVVCSVWHAGRICGAYRRLVEELPDLALNAPVFRINEEEYSFMKDIGLCGGSQVLLCFLSSLSSGAPLCSMALCRAYGRSSRL